MTTRKLISLAVTPILKTMPKRLVLEKRDWPPTMLKRPKKPALIAKTSVVLDIKPWDDETDMDAMLKNVKTIVKEGLLWGASKLVPVGYGINKLRVMCVVEDEKVSIDELCEQIAEFEDFVQSVDIDSMSKI